ncbi:homoserine dehydrogenase [Pseudomonas gingeri]|uniref:homoserine dehydrogenase n=1 Tax=Pseudomonas gingeri TaxID=117681 RepID=UPI0035295C2C
MTLLLRIARAVEVDFDVYGEHRMARRAPGARSLTMKRWNIAITGFGSIGKAVAQILRQREQRYKALYGADVRVVAVCGSRAGLMDHNGLAFDTERALSLQPGLTGEGFIEQAQADVLIEAGPTDYETGGAGYRYIRAALGQGMHAIAISKGALVFDYRGLADLARANGAQLKISGATSAALPTIDLLQYNLAGCQILEVEGIVTATSNFVLSRMMDGAGFSDAVAEAQRLGMAEPDPRFDVEGWDTACKINILANAAFGADLKLQDIPRDGIDQISAADIQRWKAAGVVPKLVGHIDNRASGVQASVTLKTYPLDHPFAQVSAKMKAIRVTTDVMGEIMAIGVTSPLATAAAALKDFEHLLMAAHR